MISRFQVHARGKFSMSAFRDRHCGTLILFQLNADDGEITNQILSSGYNVQKTPYTLAGFRRRDYRTRLRTAPEPTGI